MKIIKDESIKQWAVEEIQNNWGRNEREGIHLTDLMTPRKKFWQIVKPIKPTIDDILTWLPGIDFESRLKRALGIETPPSQQWEGIWYSCDVYSTFPTEIKLRRRQLAEQGKEHEDYDWYLKQLLGYCAVTNKQQGWLIVFTPVQKVDNSHKTKSDIDFCRVEFSIEELETERIRLRNTYALLLQSLNERDFRILPSCPDWMCGSVKKEMVKKGYCKTCDREFETEWGLQRHTESKKGKGHVIVMPEYQEIYEARCKWYKDCKEVI